MDILVFCLRAPLYMCFPRPFLLKHANHLDGWVLQGSVAVSNACLPVVGVDDVDMSPDSNNLRCAPLWQVHKTIIVCT